MSTYDVDIYVDICDLSILAVEVDGIKGTKTKSSRKGRASSWPLDRCTSRPSGDFIKDSLGRFHVVVPSFGPSAISSLAYQFGTHSQVDEEFLRW
jgi:hypothetical protein